MDNDTGELIGLHPLYDHNNAFDKGDMEHPLGGDSLIMQGHSKKEATEFAIKHCNFKINHSLTIKEFAQKDHYESFRKRAEGLGLMEKRKTLDVAKDFFINHSRER